jgi:environmental stress-induced protein Ves
MKKCTRNDAFPSPPLMTISDVVKRLNGEIHSALSDGSGRDSGVTGEFVLHTRLPDGSSRPATAIEASTADFQIKLQQTVQILQSLHSRASKLKWAEVHRLNVGNIFYQNRQYEQAMDVYLTLLAAAVGSDEEVSIQQQQMLLYTKLLNNLAQCTLRLLQFQKTITFCTMALDHIRIFMDKGNFSCNEKDSESSSRSIPFINDDNEALGSPSDDFHVVLKEQRCKLFYKRAKAHRLKGEYNYAQLDLDNLRKESKSQRFGECNDCRSATAGVEVQWNLIVRKEEQLLKRAIVQENLNVKRQRKAMHLVMNTASDNVRLATVSTNNHNDVHRNQAQIVTRSTISKPLSLYSDTVYLPTSSKRKYSTLRAIEKSRVPKMPSKSTSMPLFSSVGCLVKALVQYLVEFWRWFFHFLASWFAKGRTNYLKHD